MCKAIFIDIDGTLRDSKREISERNKLAVKKAVENGIYIVITSGRSRAHTEKVSRECFASPYIISSNGAELFEYEKNEVLYEKRIKKNELEKIYALTQKENLKMLITVDNKSIISKEDEDISINKAKTVGDVTEYFENGIIQCIVKDISFERVSNFIKQAREIKEINIINISNAFRTGVLTPEKAYYADIVNENVTKGKAILEFCKLKNIHPKDCMAIGDSLNDMGMFEVVGTKVAMKNATKDIIEKADIITDSNNEDGVAKIIEQILDRKENVS